VRLLYTELKQVLQSLLSSLVGGGLRLTLCINKEFYG
jgi:hypothetical protein